MPDVEHNDFMERMFYNVRVERARQEQLFSGRKNTTLRWLAILMEEVGELAQALLDGDQKNLEVELVQVAAVAVAWGEHILKGDIKDER